MNLKEFSDEFDTLLNSYSSTPEFGKIDALPLDEYEKSIFLTEAQEDLIVGLYKGTINYQSFESTEEIRRYLDSLVQSKSITSTGEVSLLGYPVFELPDDLLFITLEVAKISSSDCFNGSTILVVPTTQDEYYRTIQNPFRGANHRRVLRLDSGSNKVELISSFNIEAYILRYLSRPSPIILTDLPEGMKIRDLSGPEECKLNPILHRTILRMAVDKAIASKSITGSK